MNITLVNRYGFVRKDGRTGDDYVNSRWNYIFVTDIYDVDGKLHAVYTELTDHYSFDIADDHGSRQENVSFWVFPISQSDASSADRVAECIEQRKKEYRWRYSQDRLPEESVRSSEAAFGEYILSMIPKAMTSIQAAQQEAELRAAGARKPNAVGVNYAGNPYEKTIYAFDEAGICRAIGEDVSQVNIRSAEVIARQAALRRPLCWIQRAHVKSGAIHNRPMSALLDWSLDGDLVICGYEDEKPAPLTEAEVADITKAIAEFTYRYKNRI